jgi:hypothetical protein
MPCDRAIGYIYFERKWGKDKNRTSLSGLIMNLLSITGRKKKVLLN